MENILNQEVLVLNKTWTAINFTNVERAMKLLFSSYKNGDPKAVVIDAKSFAEYTWADWSLLKPDEGEEFIKSTKQTFRLPRVVKLTRYDKLPVRKAKFNRRGVYERDKYTCQYCGCKPPVSELSLDHILPKSRGGKSTWENVALSCVKCNVKKADRTPEEAGMKLHSEPKKPLYSTVKCRKMLNDWKSFLDEAYWEVELK